MSVLLTELERAGLAGRGGAGFPTAVKLRAALEHRAEVIVNACDGEIGAVKDGWVVEHHLAEMLHGAHLLADGRPVTVAAHRGSRTEQLLVAAGVRTLGVPHRYVSSEESALVQLHDGGLARPMTKVLPVVMGGTTPEGRGTPPTLVINAETAWRVAQVAAHGADWFRAHGTAQAPGPRLVGVVGDLPDPKVVETAAGVPVADLVALAGGRPQDVPYAIVGGLGGVLVRGEDLLRLRWDEGDLATVGARLGPGVLAVLGPDRCPVDVVTGMLDHAAGESAGQCGPCMFGMPALAQTWRRSLDDPRVVPELLDRTRLLVGRGACRFPDGTAAFAASAVHVLADHLQAHRTAGCPSSYLRSSHAHLV